MNPAEAMAMAGIMEKEAAIKCVLGVEEAWTKESAFKAILQPTRSGTLTYLLIPDPSNKELPPESWKWIWIKDGESIDDHLIQHNWKHFSQVGWMPFAKEKLAELLGINSWTPFVQAVLMGTASMALPAHPLQSEINKVLR